MSARELTCWKCPARFTGEDDVEALAQHAAKKHGVDPTTAMDLALEVEETADAMAHEHASNKGGRPGNPSFDAAEALRLRHADPPMSIKKIARKLGVGVSRTRSALNDAKLGAPRKAVDMVQVDQAKASGKTQEHAAAEQGVHRNTIGRRLKERGAAGMNVVQVLRAKRERLAMLEAETSALREELAEVARLLATE